MVKKGGSPLSASLFSFVFFSSVSCCFWFMLSFFRCNRFTTLISPAFIFYAASVLTAVSLALVPWLPMTKVDGSRHAQMPTESRPLLN